MPKNPLQIVSCLIFDDRGRLLLLQRHSQDLGGGMWAAPGGTCEPGESLITTLQREVLEETGLAVADVTYLGRHEMRMPHGVAHITTFQTTVSGNEQITIDPFEHETHDWFMPPEIFRVKNIIWGLPTTLRDFGFVDPFEHDPTLADGSTVIALEIAALNK